MNQKDKDAIAHVASVSKHPHAAMIAEWLVTGCKVERYDEHDRQWRNVPNSKAMIWHLDAQYRLVRPKPAYRVFKDVNSNKTYTRDSTSEPRDNGLVDHYVWISDWIELPPKWPTELVERIAAIDIDVANWIVENWDELDKDKYSFGCVYNKNSDKLPTMFRWSASPHNPDYLLNISRKLVE